MTRTFFMNHFGNIIDTRQEWKVLHKLYDIIFLTVSAVIGGCEGWEEIEDFGESRLDWLRQYGEFKNGIPHHDTIARTISRINPKHLQDSFISWMQEYESLTKGAVVAIDGKTVRRSYDSRNHKAPIHMISAYCTENSQVLGQLKTSEKSNEITAIPELLSLLDLYGCFVTIDAMGCQTKIAKTIIEKNADYCLAVKANQKRLHSAFEQHILDNFDRAKPEKNSDFKTVENAHGRAEKRLYTTLEVEGDFLDLSYEWPGMKSIGIAISQRKHKGEPEGEFIYRFYILSKHLAAEEFAKVVRSHWDIENKLHWQLDVSMREDDCKISRQSAPENLAGIRHLALNLLKRDTSRKAGIRRKQKMAAYNETYMSQVIEG